ncbi:MAG: hypothetical protein R6X14_10120 [bacterium]
MADSLIPTHGGYRKLRSFRAAQAADDAAVVCGELERHGFIVALSGGGCSCSMAKEGGSG